MPLDENAPRGMLRWISEEDNSPEAQEKSANAMLNGILFKDYCEKQWALPPEQRDPSFVRLQELNDEAEAKAEYRRKTGYYDMSPIEWERRERKKMQKRASGGGWFKKLFGL